MANTGIKKILIILLIIITILYPNIGYEETEDIEDSVHYKMLKKLKMETEEETLLRRGEIVFFISFGYVWMYQFLLYDQILAPSFNDKAKIGQLSDRNLYFAVITSIVVALFIARNDSQFIHYTKYNKVYSLIDKTTTYKESYNDYNWYFSFFSWEF